MVTVRLGGEAKCAQQRHPRITTLRELSHMCGVVGSVSRYPVNQLLYDALLLLQHRGQDAAGIATMNGNSFAMHKANGLVRDVFRTRNMRSLVGNVGIVCGTRDCGCGSDCLAKALDANSCCDRVVAVGCGWCYCAVVGPVGDATRGVAG